MCEVVDIGYKASEQCYVYDCTPLYNPALQGLFLCRDKDLRKSRFGVGEEIAALGDGMKVLDLRYLEGRFCYRIGRGGVGGKERESGVQKDELLLEEEDLVRIVEGRLKENQRP